MTPDLNQLRRDLGYNRNSASGVPPRVPPALPETRPVVRPSAAPTSGSPTVTVENSIWGVILGWLIGIALVVLAIWWNADPICAALLAVWNWICMVVTFIFKLACGILIVGLVLKILVGGE